MATRAVDTDLLGPQDPAPADLVNPAGAAPVLVTCEHGGRIIPAALGDLGVSAETLARHIAYDPGAAAVARALCRALDAPGVICPYTRLVVDPNREPDDPTLVPAIADGTIVPGNRNLGIAGKATRVAAIHRPFHEACSAAAARQRARAGGHEPVILSIHSFTPRLSGGALRPWHVGILWKEPGAFAQGLIARLQAQTDLRVGDNAPYDARNAHGYTLETHAQPFGRAHALIELRNDLIADDDAAAAWAARLADVVTAEMAAIGLAVGR